MHRTDILALVLLLIVTELARSADGSGPEVLRDLYGDPLPPGAVARMGSVRFKHKNGVHGAAFAPDGKALATFGNDGLRVWEVATGRLLKYFEMPYERYGRRILYSPDGKTLSVDRFRGGEVVLLDTVTWKKRRTLRPESQVLDLFAFSPDGRFLLSMAPDLCLWDTSTDKGKNLADAGVGYCVPQGAKLADAAFTPDGKTLVWVDDKTNVCVWNPTAASKCRHFMVVPHQLDNFHYWTAVVSRDGSAVATCAEKDGVRVWDVAKGKERFILPKPVWRCSPLTFSPDGKLLAYCKDITGVRVVDAINGKLLRQFETTGVGSLAFSPDNKTLAGTGDYAVQIWDLTTGKERPRLPEHQASAEFVGFSPSGKTLVTVADDDSLRLWDAATGGQLWSIELGRDSERKQGRSAAFTPDGRAVIARGNGSGIQTWDVETGKLLSCLHVKQPVGDIALSRDGQFLAAETRSDKGKPDLHIFDLASNQAVVTIPLGHRSGPFLPGRIAFAPDSSLLAVIDENDQVGLLDARTLKLIRRIREGSAPPQGSSSRSRYVAAVAFGSDGRILATGGGAMPNSDRPNGGPQDNAARLWDTATGNLLVEMIGHKYSLHTVAMAPDGRTLATGSWDGTLRLWEVATGKELVRFCDEGNAVNHVAFSADGERLASAMGDGSALVWELKPPSWRQPAERPTANTLDRLWNDLADNDAPAAHRAIWTLAAFPAASLPLLGEKLKPIPPVTPERLRRLIADLDHDEFDRRDAAQKQLGALGCQVEAELRQTLAKTRAAEVRKAISELLETPPRKWAIEDPALRQAVRGVWVLQRIGAPDARKHLEALAAGVPSERLTREAKDALAWLDRRAKLSR